MATHSFVLLCYDEVALANGLLRTHSHLVPCSRQGPKGGEERILAAEAEAEAYGHDEEAGADRPERSVPGHMQESLQKALK